MITRILISILPFNFMKLLIFNKLFGYQIENSKIGFGVVILADRVEIKNSTIKRNNILKCSTIYIVNSTIKKNNRFINISSLVINENVTIVSGNKFYGMEKRTTPFFQFQNIEIMKNSIITNNHYFDVSDSILIGSNVTVAGRSSQFWTHSFDLNHTKVQSPIKIGDNVYIGSACIIQQGITIANNVMVGAGTVIHKNISESGLYVSSQMIKKSNINYINIGDAVDLNGFKFTRK